MTLIEYYEDLQQTCFAEVNNHFQSFPEFKDKVTSVCYCSPLVMKDLSDLHYKRYFNFDVALMGIRPNPETTIPLGVCLYVERLPTAYALGDINLERNAFEIHFIETSNFSGLSSWINLLLSILLSLKAVIENETENHIDKICIVNPVEDTIAPLKTMGFEYDTDFEGKGNQASILQIK